MPLIIEDCPRCNSKKITFDVLKVHVLFYHDVVPSRFEAFSVCRNCMKSTIFIIVEKDSAAKLKFRSYGGFEKADSTLNNFFNTESFVCIRDIASIEPPEHLPKPIQLAFSEGTTCFAVGCFNAAGTMLRLSLDLATKSLLPLEDENGLNPNIRRSLGLRLNWLFNNKLLPEEMKSLSTCIKDDGNDGAHDGSLQREDVEDLIDFTIVLLEKLYTLPERIKLSEERRANRRSQN